MEGWWQCKPPNLKTRAQVFFGGFSGQADVGASNTAAVVTAIVQGSKSGFLPPLVLGGTAAMPGEDDTQRNVLLFDVGKNEICSPSDGFKALSRKLRSAWKIGTLVPLFSTISLHDAVLIPNPILCPHPRIKEEIHTEKLQTARVVAFGGPRAKFTAAEVWSFRFVRGRKKIRREKGKSGGRRREEEDPSTHRFLHPNFPPSSRL